MQPNGTIINPLANPTWDIIQAPVGYPTVWVGDINTTSMTPTSQTANQLRINRIGGGKFPGGFMRWTAPTGGGNTQFINWTDQQNQLNVCYTNNSQAYPLISYVLAIDPVTSGDAYALAGATWNDYGLGVVLLTMTASVPFKTGQQLSPGWNPSNGFYDLPGSSGQSTGASIGPFPDNRQTITILVTGNGSGYTSPVVTLTGGTYVTPATAAAVLKGTTIDHINVIGGSGYTVAAPRSTITDGGLRHRGHGDGRNQCIVFQFRSGFTDGHRRGLNPSFACCVAECWWHIRHMSPSVNRPTLLNSIDLTGYMPSLRFYDGNSTVPLGDAILCDSDCGFNTWVNATGLCSDDYAYQLGKYFLSEHIARSLTDHGIR